VLNAAHVREEWREKKRKLESGEDTGEREGKGKKRRVGSGGAKGKMLGIQPGESLGHFNRWVSSTWLILFDD